MRKEKDASKESKGFGGFRTALGQTIFNRKYARYQGQSWSEKAYEISRDVCGGLLPEEEVKEIERLIREFKFLPGGRYIYYAGRDMKAYNNCYLLRAEEDTREEWSAIKFRASSCLMTGGGIGIDYSRLRASGAKLSRTGGTASGPIPLMYSINEIGRNIMQGGSRRSAIYASLNWSHPDSGLFLVAKNWKDQFIKGAINYQGLPMTVADAKVADFDYHAPLDMTNVSLNYDDRWLNDPNRAEHETFVTNVRQALSTGEPGFSFNFGSKQNETLRNACTEVTSEDDSDVCNLGSLNLARISTLEEFRSATILASRFLVCGTLRASLPYAKVHEIREKNRRLGLGLMGIHEWLIQRGMSYEVTPELHKWLQVYKDYSVSAADGLCSSYSISKPVAYRAIAPTGTIGILAGTTTGIEPIFATAYKRRYLDGTKWKYQYVIDETARAILEETYNGNYSTQRDARHEAIKHGEVQGRDGQGRYEVQERNGSSSSSSREYANVPPSSSHNNGLRTGNNDTRTGTNIHNLDTAYGLSSTNGGIERRLKFQSDAQSYVDMSISSTINCPRWGTTGNERDNVRAVARLISKYAPGLRGLTLYPDGARGGQPLEVVDYEEAKANERVVFEANDSCLGGVCGI